MIADEIQQALILSAECSYVGKRFGYKPTRVMVVETHQSDHSEYIEVIPKTTYGLFHSHNRFRILGDELHLIHIIDRNVLRPSIADLLREIDEARAREEQL
jgi:hypothetical protein